MRIDKALNLVVPIESADGTIYFHSSPVSRETFQKYHMVIARTFTQLLTAGLELTGAKVAAMHLETVAVEMGIWDTKEGVRDGLLAEIARLTNVLALTERGWEALPVDVAIKREFVSEDDWEEAKQRIVFFILISAMTSRQVRDDLMEIMNSSWETRTTSSNCTDFATSLPISTETETLPVKRSPVPA
jgi:hypothetical protein